MSGCTADGSLLKANWKYSALSVQETMIVHDRNGVESSAVNIFMPITPTCATWLSWMSSFIRAFVCIYSIVGFIQRMRYDITQFNYKSINFVFPFAAGHPQIPLPMTRQEVFPRNRGTSHSVGDTSYIQFNKKMKIE